GRHFELHERVHRLLRRLENIETALMGADLKLLSRLLVHVRGTQHAVLVFHRRQRDRSSDLRPRAACRVHNFTRGLVENAIIVSFQADPNSFFTNHVSFSLIIKEQVRGSSAFPRSARRLLPRLVSGCGGCHRTRYKTYAIISLMVPAPTVRPPSRIANRKPFSIATGVINSISSCTLSPGITISVPAGNVATPVTSVVRK